MKKIAIFLSTAAIITSSVLSSLALAESVVTPSEAAERLYGFVTTPDSITFQVYSGGCTGKSSFLVSKQQARGDSTMRVTLVRVKPDNCRGFFVHGELITYSLSELDLEGSYFEIENSVSHPFAKAGNN